MKRFHVHVSVKDRVAQSIGFYSKLFGATPSIEKVDYAKWMLWTTHVLISRFHSGVMFPV